MSPIGTYSFELHSDEPLAKTLRASLVLICLVMGFTLQLWMDFGECNAQHMTITSLLQCD